MKKQTTTIVIRRLDTFGGKFKEILNDIGRS